MVFFTPMRSLSVMYNVMKPSIIIIITNDSLPYFSPFTFLFLTIVIFLFMHFLTFSLFSSSLSHSSFLSSFSCLSSSYSASLLPSTSSVLFNLPEHPSGKTRVMLVEIYRRVVNLDTIRNQTQNPPGQGKITVLLRFKIQMM